ncbi:DUF5067 domain-containing protein [Cytobacillus kochii]|uniref:DUF5067 domain-containing protein n=1 Tax=Cytobacillus kochii TaxID=859143 RepID=UPI001CD1C675|nr:DUF5067 domain-containing protein [Cytobacillus kochii]MCA1029210.1 DUF5067 domain-containing protein [Cytobacillus kochii]
MKKVLFLMIGMGMFLTACGSNEEAEPKKENEPIQAEKVVAEENESNSTFENGVLETEKYTLSVEKTEVIQSPMEDKPGLFITFNLTNKTQDEDIVPDESLGQLLFQQENETSRVDLFSNYHFLDAFGEDTETYNKMVDLSNANANALLPGKSVEFVQAYTLDNEDNDVTFVGVDEITLEPLGDKQTIKIK